MMNSDSSAQFEKIELTPESCYLQLEPPLERPSFAGAQLHRSGEHCGPRFESARWLISPFGDVQMGLCFDGDDLNQHTRALAKQTPSSLRSPSSGWAPGLFVLPARCCSSREEATVSKNDDIETWLANAHETTNLGQFWPVHDDDDDELVVYSR